ncbi:MAG: beta-galactosidase trimerization domain-containing protein, partial [Planctomycetota bacterium]
MRRGLSGRQMAALAVLCVLAAGARPGRGQDDPYEVYINTSKDFQPVKQDKDWCYESFPSWTYMPWSYRWNIGYTQAAGKWSLEHGYNGAFLDWGRTIVDGYDKLAWINQHGLRFYMDHTAAKRYLHVWDGNHVNDALKATLEGFITTHINNVKSSPYRAAYALDDEISWGHFVHPTMWQITDDFSAYTSWLTEIYGPSAPVRTNWITYDNIRGSLPSWRIREFDASQLMDQWTFNDSHWNNFIGDLVEHANAVDPRTPCGWVGGQTPNAFGGYDYAKIMKKVQYIESYNLGGTNSLIRSFNPSNAIPSVTTHFHSSVMKTVWETWYYLAHGNRGHIGWVSGWFSGTTPQPWHDQVAPHYLEAGDRIGPLMARAEWKHDGVAILYNHASIQMSWILDAQAHGSTWVNRNGDYKRGSSHLVRRAWENMLRDEGIQYDFVAYDDVIRDGVPDEYKVLILPAALCLSDAEARRIREFVAAGGTVIADYMPGLWDQHGKGRRDGGVLDDVFGVTHSRELRASDVFQSSLWCEVDQDANFSYSDFATFLTNGNDCIMDASGFHKAVRNMPVMKVNDYGEGRAVLMNLSPQWYNAYRNMGYAVAAEKRSAFTDFLGGAGVDRWVEIEDAGAAEHGYEITYWEKDGRTIVMLVLNREDIVSSTVAGLRDDVIPITLKFDTPVLDARNERTGAGLGDGMRFD